MKELSSLIEQVKDKALQLSLGLIHQTTKKIWTDEIRIIRDYTDHGIPHSERLAKWACKLLEANNGEKLSDEEMYLLLAGIYLHDIGMQCDIVKFSDIKKRAENSGAKFDIKFTAQTASNYTKQEQNEIRKNHHHLSAAWIEYAYDTGETVLGSAAKTIPKTLVTDLMDVCKYHSKLNITECPLELQRNPKGRKQLLAAILRFSDELDVDAKRVSVETVKDFRYEPDNSLYWWLHDKTQIDFYGPYVIRITIWLNKDDVEKYGTIIQETYIDEFSKKNWPVITILGKNCIPVIIASDSEVKTGDKEEPLPEKIAIVLKNIKARKDFISYYIHDKSIEPPLEKSEQISDNQPYDNILFQKLEKELIHKKELLEKTQNYLNELKLMEAEQGVLFPPSYRRELKEYEERKNLYEKEIYDLEERIRRLNDK